VSDKKQSRVAQIAWMTLTVAGILFLINQGMIWAGIGSMWGK